MIELVFNYGEAKSSAGLRSYISNNYSLLQKLNPDFDFLLRPWDGPAQVTCVYDYGNCRSVEVDNKDEKQIERELENLIHAAELMPRSGTQSEPVQRDLIVE